MKIVVLTLQFDHGIILYRVWNANLKENVRIAKIIFHFHRRVFYDKKIIILQ